MTDQPTLHEYLMSYPNVWVDTPFNETTLAYKIGQESDGGGKFFALVEDGSTPLRLSVKCDPQLAELLREKYETVLPGHNLSKKNWNTILCTGQVGNGELQDFIRLSYQLVAEDR